MWQRAFTVSQRKRRNAGISSESCISSLYSSIPENLKDGFIPSYSLNNKSTL